MIHVEWKVHVTCNDESLLIEHRLVGLVVKASVSGAEGPEFDSRFRRGDFSRSSHTSGYPAMRLAL